MKKPLHKVAKRLNLTITTTTTTTYVLITKFYQDCLIN